MAIELGKFDVAGILVRPAWPIGMLRSVVSKLHLWESRVPFTTWARRNGIAEGFSSNAKELIMPDFLKIGDEIGILINRITEAWADLPVPKAADLFPEGFEVSESSSPDEWEQHDAFCGKRYDELDCEFLESVVCNAIVGLSDNATSYYLGGICLCDLKNYDGPLDLERRTDEAVTFFAHMSDRFEPSHFFTDAQAAAFRDFVRFVARTRPGSMAESGAKYVLDWLS